MIHIRWKAVNAYQANQQTSLNPIASPEPGSRMGLKRNRVERRYKFMKCKRLCAWLLSLVMMFSLLPVSAAAADHEPTIKWGGLTPLDYTLSVQVFHENEGLQWEKTETEKHLWVDVHPASGTEVYKADSDGGSYLKETGHFTFGLTTKASLKLYTRSTAGHKVTVEYVYTDDESKNDSKFENVKYAEEKSFGSLDKNDYGYEITVSSGDAKYEVNSLNVLRVTGGAEASVITVTYTPKDVIYIDQYYDNGKLWVKWTENNIKVNGPELLNGAAEAAVIEGENLTDAVENYRFLTVDGVTYDFSFASLVPVKGSILQPITDVWYDRDEGTWYYSHTDRKGVLFGLGDKVPVVNRGCVNFCYNTPHTENSEHHDWKWVHVDGTEKENSQHQQVCKHCNKEGTIERCKFDLPTTETGTHTCKDCGYSYTDEITPTGTPVYVYFKTVNTKNELVKVESGVTYNANGSSWATLGKLVTATTVTPEKKNILGAEVKTSSNFVKHDSNKDFNLDWISEWVDLKQDNGAAGYESEAPFGTHVWHLDGQVNVCKLSYDANRPAGVTADVTVPDSAYYLPNWNAPVSTDVPKLQGYDFGGWYKEREFVTEAKGTVAVTEDTVLYAKWTSQAQPTADLIDDNIIIKHGVNAAPADGDDPTAHIVNKDAKISYQATLDMKSLSFGANPENAAAVSKIKKVMAYAGTTSLWEFMKGKDITMFAGSAVNLYVKFSNKLVNPAALDGITLESGWFKLDPDPKNKPTYDKATGYWTIPCVIKKDAADTPDTTNPTFTLSGITLPLTAKAQDELSSDTDLDIISEGYIDGTIKISALWTTYMLKLEGKSKDDPAKNTAKLKLAVPTYTVTYDANGGSGTMTDKNSPYADGAVATVLTNGFTRSRYTFTGWNTKADGRGDSYKTGDRITMTDNVVLYAQWTRNSSHDNDDDKYFFAIQKVDAQDGHALNGAKFELYQRDSRDNKLAASRKTTASWGTESGIALFSVSATKTNEGGDTWYYREITAPEGYVLDSTEHKIKAKNFSDSRSTAVKYADAVRNYRGTTPDLLNDSDHFAYVIGYMDGNVRPYGLISRAETTTIFFRLLKDSVRDGNLLTSNTYTDVADDYWANTAISTMTGLGIVQGRSTTTFDPKAPITRAQFAAICARFDTGKSSGTQSFTDIKGHWAEKYIQRAAELGWIKGFEDGTFRPDTYITRAQAMTMINRVLNRIPEENSDLLPGMNVWPDCNPGDWFYLAVQEATNSHDFEHKAGSYETWTKLMKSPDWTRYEN